MSHVFRAFLITILLMTVSFNSSVVEAKSKSSSKRSKSKKRKKKKKKSTKTQSATVIVDGATVYKKPSFDSDVLDYLDQGKKIKVSKKRYPGAGGLGVFYKTRLKDKRMGYLVDTEVKPKNSVTTTDDSGTIFDSFDDPSQPQQQEQANQAPIYFTRYLGVGVNFVNMTETYESKKLTAFSPLLSFKMTGPGVLVEGLPLDIEINVGMQAPEYYNKFSSNQSGFFTLASLGFVSPLSDAPRSLVYYGFGLMAVYEKFDVEVKPGNPSIDSQEFRAGVALTFGYAHKIGSNYLIRAEGKYYYEKEGYIATSIALQRTY